MISLLLAATLGPGSPADFRAAFPAASIVESPAGGRLTHASGFEAPGLGDTPEATARAFLAKYGAAFGIRARTVPPIMINTPTQIHMTSGFRCALMMGRPVPSLTPS